MYTRHKANAKRRGITFDLSFDEWWGIWTESRRWSQRGWKPGQFVMSRYGDEGPYAVGNVYISGAKRNLKDARKKAVRAIKRHTANSTTVIFV
jgi:hypothetical protein